MNTRILVLLIALTVLVAAMASAQISSAQTGNWGDVATWVGGVVPTSTDNVIIANDHNVTVAAAGAVCNNITVNANGTLSTQGLVGPPASNFLTPSGTITLYGNWIQGGTASFISSGTKVFDDASTVTYNGTFADLVDFTFGNLVWQAGALGLTSNLTVNGNLSVLGAAKMKGTTILATRVHHVKGNVTLNSSGSPVMDGVDGAVAATVTWNIDGNLDVQSGRLSGLASSAPFPASATFNIGGNLTIGAAGQLQYATSSASTGNVLYSIKGNFTSEGNIVKQGGGTPGTWTISMDGTAGPQNLAFVTAVSAKSSNVLARLVVNNPDGVTLTAPMLLDQNWTMDLAGGKLYTTSDNLLTVGSAAGAGFANASATRFVDGSVAYTSTASTGVKTYTYPIGKETAYRPITLSLNQSAAAASIFTAEMFNSAPPANTVSAPLTHVSYNRHYIISESAGGSAFTAGAVTLSYGADDKVTDGANLRVAQNDGAGNWVNLGGTGTGAPTGTILSTTAFTSLTGTVFTLADVSADPLVNPLPVEMTSFTAVIQGTTALLNWTTATETNNSGFQIERSVAGSGVWVEVAFVAGAGTTNAPLAYSYEDKNLDNGGYVYRIKQIDNVGGGSEYFYANADIGASKGLQLMGNYPNPFNPSTNMQFSVPQDGYASLKVYNMLGQEVATLFSGNAVAGHFISAKFDGSRFASGIYFARLQYNGKSLVQRMLMTK